VATTKLPVKLKDVPIVDAMFELRFKAAVPASSVLPGYLFSGLEGEKQVQRLPTAELPEAMRNLDINLQYAPHIRIIWERFTILVSDRSFGVSCLLPYPGWSSFKKAIVQVSGVIASTKLLIEVERMSLKYTNIFPYSLGKAREIVEFDLKLGTKDVRDGLFHVRAEISDGDALHLVQIAPQGLASLVDGSSREGTVIDIDTIRNNEDKVDPTKSFEHLPQRLDDLHLKTKAIFFSFLKAAAIEKLGPTYE
jgi:uncharacterized protein (TIGR04255 family)